MIAVESNCVITCGPLSLLTSQLVGHTYARTHTRTCLRVLAGAKCSVRPGALRLEGTAAVHAIAATAAARSLRVACVVHVRAAKCMLEATR